MTIPDQIKAAFLELGLDEPHVECRKGVWLAGYRAEKDFGPCVAGTGLDQTEGDERASRISNMARVFKANLKREGA